MENESDMIVKGRDMTTGLPRTVTIYTNEIYHCLKEMLDTIGEEARLRTEGLHQSRRRYYQNAA